MDQERNLNIMVEGGVEAGTEDALSTCYMLTNSSLS